MFVCVLCAFFSVSTVSSETASRPNKRLVRTYHWIGLFNVIYKASKLAYRIWVILTANKKSHKIYIYIAVERGQIRPHAEQWVPTTQGVCSAHQQEPACHIAVLEILQLKSCGIDILADPEYSRFLTSAGRTLKRYTVRSQLQEHIHTYIGSATAFGITYRPPQSWATNRNRLVGAVL
jgi:hypothetical protein